MTPTHTPPERGVSVVICTYNGGERIERVLAALAAQHCSRPAEIILVDNNSTDGVGETARRYWTGLPDPKPPLEVVLEAEQGLSAARRCGASLARYELVLYCDDDNLLHPSYFEEGARLMDDPRIAVVGGGGVPLFEMPPPPFIFSRIGYLACGDRYRSDESVGARHAIVSDGRPANIFGAGMFVRREDLRALFAMEEFPILSDRNGAALSGGNDCEICFMLMLAGGLLVYSDDLRFDHIIPAGRLTADYFHRLRHGGVPGREYWRRLAECHMARRDGARAFRPGALLNALLALMGRRDRGNYHLLACALGIEAFSNGAERTAMRMARRARKIERARPIAPQPVELELTRTDGRSR